MKQVIICPEFPPAPSGGIGTYGFHIAHLLAEEGQTVHVVAPMWEGAEEPLEKHYNNRLIIHRVPFKDWKARLGWRTPKMIRSPAGRFLNSSPLPAQSFGWQASLLAEQIIEEEAIDLVEAQEFEAPLYYLQLRRALRLGPQRRPPCLIHLHSPTAFIAQHNEWDPGLPQISTASRLEQYSIRAADALLCPSHYLAGQVEQHYGLAPGKVRVIRYPMGDTPFQERSEEAWNTGSICYVGRLERRKGVLEWIDAAVAVASENARVTFEFIGANVLSTTQKTGQLLLENHIPRELRPRFRFFGNQPRTSLSEFWQRARMAVVPSRWENFPNVCIEAMSSGLPVLATVEGGMAEMIEDGLTGWLAPAVNPEALASTLRRALETPPGRLAEMGREASLQIRRMCDNDKVIQEHLEFRSQVACSEVLNSQRIPVSLPSSGSGTVPAYRAMRSSLNRTGGLVIVVVCDREEQSAGECLATIEKQSRKPEAVVLVKGPGGGSAFKRDADPDAWIVQSAHGNRSSMKNIALESIRAAGLSPIGYVFLDLQDRLEPHFLDCCENTLRHCPEVGIVSCWLHYDGVPNGVQTQPNPCFPYQWLRNDAAPCSVLRVEAIEDAGPFRPGLHEGFESWDLVNAILAAGWTAVTFPGVLARRQGGSDSLLRTHTGDAHRGMKRILLERFPELVARDAKDIILLTESSSVKQIHQAVAVMKRHLRESQLAAQEESVTAHSFPRRSKARVAGQFYSGLVRLISLFGVNERQ